MKGFTMKSKSPSFPSKAQFTFPSTFSPAPPSSICFTKPQLSHCYLSFWRKSMHSQTYMSVSCSLFRPMNDSILYALVCTLLFPLIAVS